MKPLHQIFLCLVVTILIFSCSSKYRIPEEYFDLIPYEGDEILYFESSDSKMDSIVLRRYERLLVGSDPLAIFPDKFERYSLICKRSDPNYDRSFEGKTLVELSAGPSEAYLTFGIMLRRAWYYGESTFSVQEFHDIPLTQLQIGETIYDDVKVFESDGSYKQRDNYVERFYWSVSKGFLGLDNKNDFTYRLVKVKRNVP